MAAIDAAVATFERNIEAATGQPVAAWVAAIRQTSLEKHGAIMAWLKTEHGMSHSHANHVAKRALEAAAPRSTDDPVAHLFPDGKDGMRPLYDRLVAAIMALGPDIEIVPKKANASVRRTKQFALIQPSTKTRIDLGLILKNREPNERLEASGSFNAMFTHRVKLGSIDDIDANVIVWLRDAYAAAAG
jgi:hypothetical protein